MELNTTTANFRISTKERHFLQLIWRISEQSSGFSFDFALIAQTPETGGSCYLPSIRRFISWLQFAVFTPRWKTNVCEDGEKVAIFTPRWKTNVCGKMGKRQKENNYICRKKEFTGYLFAYIISSGKWNMIIQLHCYCNAESWPAFDYYANFKYDE